MKYLPIGLNVREKKCLVVGGGPIGERKVRNLLGAGAAVSLVSPEVTRGLADLAASGRISLSREEYREEHLDGVFLAVAATDDRDLNARVAEAAGSRGILVCDASSAIRSEVIFGALHSQEGLTVAVFTDGEDPSRARRVRDRIAGLVSQGEGGGATPLRVKKE